MCRPFFRIETETGKCFPLEFIVLVHEYKDFFHVLSFLFFPKRCQLDISIDSLAIDSATDFFEFLMEVIFEAVPCYWVTICIILREKIRQFTSLQADLISYLVMDDSPKVIIAFFL